MAKISMATSWVPKLLTVFIVASPLASCKVVGSRDRTADLKDDPFDGDTYKAKRVSERRMQRFQESQAPVVRTMINATGKVGEDFRRSIELKDAEIFTNENVSYDAIRGIRLSLAALMKNEVSREISVRASLDAIRRRSMVLKSSFLEKISIQQRSRSIDPKFDFVIVGAGPGSAILAQSFLEENPELKILIVDSRDKPGGTFADVESSFLLNSTNRESVGERPTPGRGDLNYLSDLVGMPDFEAVKWPVAGKMGQLVTTLLDMSSADVLLETEVEDIASNVLQKNSTLTLRDISSDKTFTIDTKMLIISSGLGDPKETFSASTRASIEAEKSELAGVNAASGLDVPASVESVVEAMERIGQSETPLRPYINRSLVVAGDGDSARVAWELPFRLGPEGAYGRDVAQVGKVGPAYWIAPYETCEQFLNGDPDQDIEGVRSRYARLFGEISSGNIKLVPGRLVDAKEVPVTREDGSVRIEREIIYRTKDGRTLSSLKDGFMFADPKRTGPIETRMVSERGSAAYTITATGFSPTRLIRLLQPLFPNRDLDNPGDLERIFNPLEAPLREYGNENKRYGLQVGSFPIYLAGAASAAVGQPLPEGRELARVNANTVSVFANGPRDRELAVRLAPLIENVSLYSGSLLKELMPFALAYELPIQTSFNGSRITLQRPKVDGIPKEYRSTVHPELELRVELDRIARFLRREDRSRSNITEFIFKRMGADQIEFSLAPSNKEEIEAVGRLINDGGGRLTHILFENYFKPGTRTSELKVFTPTFGPDSNKLNSNLAVISEERGNALPYESRPAIEKPQPRFAPGFGDLTITQREQIQILEEKASTVINGRQLEESIRGSFIELINIIRFSNLELTPGQLKSILVDQTELPNAFRRLRPELTSVDYKLDLAGLIGIGVIEDLWSNYYNSRANEADKMNYLSIISELKELFSENAYIDSADLRLLIGYISSEEVEKDERKVRSFLGDLQFLLQTSQKLLREGRLVQRGSCETLQQELTGKTGILRSSKGSPKRADGR